MYSATILSINILLYVILDRITNNPSVTKHFQNEIESFFIEYSYCFDTVIPYQYTVEIIKYLVELFLKNSINDS